MPRPDAIATAARQAHIIPDVIPDFPPETPVVVKWPTGKQAKLGNTLTATDTADEPSVSFTPAPGASHVGHTLVMTDLDAPSRRNPTLAEWRHWLVTGLMAPALNTGNPNACMTKASTTTPYYPPGPPRGTGPHRYVFLLYQEPSADFCLPPDAPERKNQLRDRANWSAARFARERHLTLVGLNYIIVRGGE